jgi:hypothetical protein
MHIMASYFVSYHVNDEIDETICAPFNRIDWAEDRFESITEYFKRDENDRAHINYLHVQLWKCGPGGRREGATVLDERISRWPSRLDTCPWPDANPNRKDND